MSRLSLCCLAFIAAVSCFTSAQALSTHPPSSSSSLQLIYLQDGSTLTTYSVDPQTLIATQVGQPLTLPISTFSLLIPSVNGEFLYILGTDSSQNQNLWVFATDSSGVPQPTPVQVVSTKGMYNFEFDPAANFAYAILQSVNSQGQYIYDIRQYSVDPATGKLSSTENYQLNGSCQPGVLGTGPDIDGFSADGKAFYDDWYCVYPTGTVATYYERSVNLQTGVLGPAVEVYNWREGAAGYDLVTFNNNQIIDYSVPNYNKQGVNRLSIYPVVPHSTTALVDCTAAMLQACGYSLGLSVHPSGRYIFFVIDFYTDDIASVDLAGKKLIDTTHYVPYQVSKFNSDGTIIYALSIPSSGYYIEIFGFNVANANVTPGGTITAPSIDDTFWPVTRQ